MKLLLTSNGLCNQSIANNLTQLVGKIPEETSVAFIPTAMNMSDTDKRWYINDLKNLEKYGFKNIDIVDFSALPEKVWLPRLKQADVLFFCGGHSYHLMNCLKKSGLNKLLPELLKNKVYVGISAGSLVTNPSLAFTSKDKKEKYKEIFGYDNEEALNLVNFYVRPHMYSKQFSYWTEEVLKETAKTVNGTVYGIDDESAVMVNDESVTIVGEGKFIKI